MAHGKKYKKVAAGVDRNKAYKLKEAVALIKSNATTAGRKFVETVEIAMNLNVDPTQSDQMIRGMVQMPAGTGKPVRVAVFAKADKAEEAKKAGAEHVGADDLAEKINAGFQDFDRVIATPDMMGVVGKLGKVLGPRGLMPNPKLGTVSANVAEAVKAAKGGSVEYRLEKAGIVHAGIGKVSFSEDDILRNVKAFVDAVAKAKPSAVKGTFINRITLSTTMGPGVKVEISDAIAKAA